MSEMRILTVRQPWAWAIFHDGKDVENRARNIAGSYRGPVAIHAAKALAKIDYCSYAQLSSSGYDAKDDHYLGKIIGVIDLVGVHQSSVDGCGTGEAEGPIPLCSDWAEPIMHHLVLATPRPLAEPIPYKGALGLRRLDQTTIGMITAALVAETGETA